MCQLFSPHRIDNQSTRQITVHHPVLKGHFKRHLRGTRRNLKEMKVSVCESSMCGLKMSKLCWIFLLLNSLMHEKANGFASVGNVNRGGCFCEQSICLLRCVLQRRSIRKKNPLFFSADVMSDFFSNSFSAGTAVQVPIDQPQM